MANLNKLKKYHFLYKTTNLLNGKFYVGIHSTSNLKDGYLGSGTRLRRSIRKYGEENFKMEILQFFNDRQTLFEEEKKLVNNNLLKEPLCMNLKPGGSGGLNNEAHAQKFHKAGGRAVMQLLAKRHLHRLKTDNLYRTDWLNKTKNGVIAAGYEMGVFYGKTHTDETKRKIGEANSKKQKGEKNSQFGTIWITNGTENKKIKKEERIPTGWKNGRK
jgi:hypothetical protein